MRKVKTFDPVLFQVMAIVLCYASATAADNAVKNGNFADGTSGWDIGAADPGHEIAVIDDDGQKVLKLARTAPKTAVIATQYNIPLKRDTLYRLSFESKGDAPAHFTFRPQTSKDPGYFALAKSNLTSSCPVPPEAAWKKEELVLDPGPIPENAFLNVSLEGEAPGTHLFRNIALTAIGSSAPDKDETIILHIGDSITITSYLPFSQRIDALLAAAIHKDFPQLRVRNINVGADGEYIKEFLETKRYDKIVKESLKKVDIAVIRYGGNDSRYYSADEFKKYMATLCDNLLRDYPGVQIVLGTGTAVFNNDEVNVKQYGAYWQAARDLAAERKYPLADVFAKFKKENSVKPQRGEGDMHPSPFGVQLISEAVYEALQPVLKAQQTK